MCCFPSWLRAHLVVYKPFCVKVALLLDESIENAVSDRAVKRMDHHCQALNLPLVLYFCSITLFSDFLHM